MERPYCKCHSVVMTKNGKYWRCSVRKRSQERDGHYLRRYGISLAEYNEMLISQDSQCAICGNSSSVMGRGGLLGQGQRVRHLDIDHDHKTGAIRGLLCLRCNAGMGNMNDDPVLLRRAALYLEGGDADV